MDSLKEPKNVTAHITGIVAKGEIGRVAPNWTSYFGKRLRGKWDREELHGFEFNQEGQLMSKVRIIDRKKNSYKELVINFNTRDICRDVEELLSEHTGRGSAK